MEAIAFYEEEDTVSTSQSGTRVIRAARKHFQTKLRELKSRLNLPNDWRQAPRDVLVDMDRDEVLRFFGFPDDVVNSKSEQMD